MRPWLVAAGVAAALVGIVGEFRSPVNGDVAYMLDAAGRMLGGERLYADLIDLNPPFMFWLSQPAAALADGAGSVTAFRVMVLALAAAMLALAWPVSRGQPAMRAGFVLMAFMLPLGHFGEREHVMFCLVFPYVALAVRRAGTAAAGTGLAVAIGIAAGAGMALKPPAVLLAGALAIDQWRRAGSPRVLLRSEHIAAAATLGAALLLILAAAPKYLDAVADYAGLYAAFSRGNPIDLLFGHLYAVFVFVALALVAVTAASMRSRATITVLALATLALHVSAIVQGKGFGYHYLPAHGFAVMALAELVVAESNWRTGYAEFRRVAAGVALLVMLAAPAAVAFDRFRGKAADPLPDRQGLARALAADSAGTSIAMLSIRLGDSYPLVLERRFDNVLAMPHLWFAGLDEGPAAASLWARVASDIGGRQPDVVVVRAPGAGERGAGDIEFDYLRRLCGAPGTTAALGRYGLAAHVTGYDIFRRDFKGAPACASS